MTDTQDGREPPAAPEVDALITELTAQPEGTHIAEFMEMRDPVRLRAAAALLAQQQELDAITYAGFCGKAAHDEMRRDLEFAREAATHSLQALAAARSDLRVMTDSYDAATRRQAVPREPTALVLLQQVRRSRHWPEEGQAWGYEIGEALHDAIEMICDAHIAAGAEDANG